MKSFYLSKTLWVNVLAAVALFVQQQYGFAMPPQFEAYFFIALNLFLRTVTHQELTA
jgi:hypothetical protein